MLGKPMRAAIGGGKAVIGSNVKVAAAGASLDLPLGTRTIPGRSPISTRSPSFRETGFLHRYLGSLTRSAQ
jgi:hypothetical protein